MTWLYASAVIVYFLGVGGLATATPSVLREAAEEEPQINIVIEMHPEKVCLLMSVVCVCWPLAPLMLLTGKGGGGGGGGPRGGKRLRLPATGGAR